MVMRIFYKLLFVFSPLIISCQEDDMMNEINDQLAVSELWEAEIAPRSFIVDDEKQIRGNYDYYPVMDKWALNFYGVNTAGDVIEIFIADYKGPGEYESGKNGNENFIYYATKGQKSVDGSIPTWWSGESNSAELNSLNDSGTVTITSETNTYIEGTFRFVGYHSPKNSITVQEGKFKVAVSKAELPSTDAVSEYFEAHIDKRSFKVEDNTSIHGKYDYQSAMDKWALRLFAENPEKEVVEIFISDYKGPGTYYSGESSNDNFMYYSSSGKKDASNYNSSWWSGKSNTDDLNALDDGGVVVVTTETESFVEGTFHFKGYQSSNSNRTLQEGKFKVAVSRE